jgi:hypothetical protein
MTGKAEKTAVASHLSAKIHYNENREIEAQDVGHVCSLYEIELKGVVVAIALGRARMDKGDVMYCPIYGVGDEENDEEEDEGEHKMPVAKVQLGVIEAPASAAVNILGKAALLSKKGVARRPDMAVTDYDVPLDIMGDILLYNFVTDEFLRSLKSRPETYHLPTSFSVSLDRVKSSEELEKERAQEKDKKESELAAASAAEEVEEEEDDDIFDILDDKEGDEVLLPSAKKIEESMEKGVFRKTPYSFVRPPSLNEETHKIAKQKKQQYKESPGDSWIQKFMRNADFAIVDVADNGDCFFDTVVKAFASVGRITDVATLRALVAKNATEAIFREFVIFYTQMKQQEEQSMQEIRGIKKEIEALTKARAETAAINALIETYNSKIKIHKHQKERNRELMIEFKYMEKIKTIEDFRAFILTPAFWADAWVIGLLEKELRFKAIIFGEENFEDGSRDSVMQCGGWSESEKIEPEFYIMTTYSGNHYRLVSYMGTQIFTFREIPYDVKTLIMHKCMERNAGDYEKIAEFKDWKGRFSSAAATNEATDEVRNAADEKGIGETDYDKSIVFKFYESSPSKPSPGKGNGEEIPSGKLAQFKELAVIPDWRRMLDDSWPQEGGLFAMEGHKWLSVEHYMLGAQFKKSWPDVFAAFSLDSGTAISKDVKEARKAVAQVKKNGTFTADKPKKGVSIDADFHTTTGLDGILRPGRETAERERAVREKFLKNPHLMKVLKLTSPAHLMHFIRAKPAVTDKILIRIRESG